ncbi:hypothetical protein NDI33_00835 [Trichocoleus sp. DQ-A1]
MQQIDLAAASQPLPKLIEVALRGEEITISKDNHPVVKLVPVSPLKRRPQFGSVQILHRRTSACSITNEVASESSQRTASGISSGLLVVTALSGVELPRKVVANGRSIRRPLSPQKDKSRDKVTNPCSASFWAYRFALCSLTAPIGCPTMIAGFLVF